MLLKFHFLVVRFLSMIKLLVDTNNLRRLWLDMYIDVSKSNQVKMEENSRIKTAFPFSLLLAVRDQPN